MKSPASIHPVSDSDALAMVFEKIRAALADLRFGEVRLVIHDGQVVQVERTEKVRLARAGPD